MDDLLPIIHDHWSLPVTQITAITLRENQVYQLQTRTGDYALKIARAGYHAHNTLESEMQLLAHLAAENFPVPAPIPSHSGVFVPASKLGFMSVQRWVDGDVLGQSGQPLNHPDPEGLYYAIGENIARLHDLTERWQPPKNFARPSWGRDGLTSAQPFWGAFWNNPILLASEVDTLARFRDYARQQLSADDRHLIHADLVKENILIHDKKIIFIDFDDCGYGYPIFDLATAVGKSDGTLPSAACRTAICAGYSAIRPLDTTQLNLFLALRAATYLGWIMTRPELDADGERSARYRDEALSYIEPFEDVL